MGYDVDAVQHDDRTFAPTKRYDVAIDLFTLFERFPKAFEKSVKILHFTMSYPAYSNAAEVRRCEALTRRHGVPCAPRRAAPSCDASFQAMDACFLAGNRHTLETFPPAFRAKMTLIPTVPSIVRRVKHDNYVPAEREFLFFAGDGAVLKGLDLLLDVFLRHPEWTLNIVGTHPEEPQFRALYAHCLALPSIRAHGYLSPASETFDTICARCFCFLSPTCTEGMSTSALTAMAIGLYPILSRDTGVDLPDGCGIMLETCSLDDIEAALLRAHAMSADELERQTRSTQHAVLTLHTRENYTRSLRAFLSAAIENPKV